jgi:hypothetical protein
MEYVNITLNSSLPQTTNVLMCEFDLEQFYINMDEFNPEENEIVDNVIPILENRITTTFYDTNYGYEYITINIIKPESGYLIEDVNVDFTSLSDDDKNKIGELINLILTKG